MNVELRFYGVGCVTPPAVTSIRPMPSAIAKLRCSRTLPAVRAEDQALLVGVREVGLR